MKQLDVDVIWDSLTPQGYGKSRYDIANDIEAAVLAKLAAQEPEHFFYKAGWDAAKAATPQPAVVQVPLTDTQLRAIAQAGADWLENFKVNGPPFQSEPEARAKFVAALAASPEAPAPAVVQVPRELLAAALREDAGAVICANNGPRGSESTDCTACGARNADGWHEQVTHREGCTYVEKTNAKEKLRAMLAAAPEAPAQANPRKDRLERVREFIQADAELARGVTPKPEAHPIPPQWREAMKAAVAAEREECAKVCDTTPPYPFRPSIEAAHAIRARGKA